jgi:hypothetical protein
MDAKFVCYARKFNAGDAIVGLLACKKCNIKLTPECWVIENASGLIHINCANNRDLKGAKPTVKF